MLLATSALVFGPPEWLFTGFMAMLILGIAGLMSYVRVKRERHALERMHRFGGVSAVRGDRHR
ncbi:hypothetical protein ACLD0U_14045 [Microbacterium sp. 2216-1]|uniref:hypothetical protein n=1 Tax=Microbacterium sp. 2216-1 TaxID=3390053 RepID=UPI00397554BC